MDLGGFFGASYQSLIQLCLQQLLPFAPQVPLFAKDEIDIEFPHPLQ